MSNATAVRSRWFLETWYALLAIVSSLTLGGIILLYMGESPLQVYTLLVKGSLGRLDLISATLAATTPYLLCGLALAFAFQAGLFNIGAEGQLFMGAMAAALVGRWMTVPGIGPVVVILVGIGAGMLWGYIPALLKNRFGVHEVINTIMLNYIAIYFCSWLLNVKGGTYKILGMSLTIPSIRGDQAMPRTADVAAQAQLPSLSLGGLSIDTGLLLAILLAVILLVVMRRSRLGYAVKVMGMQPKAAETAGISTAKITIIGMVISGGMAGLAGALYASSPAHPYFETGFSPGWGFWGIALALLARNHPIGVIFAALLFGMLETGSSFLDTSLGIPRELVYILEAIIILMISSRLFERLLEPDQRRT